MPHGSSKKVPSSTSINVGSQVTIRTGNRNDINSKADALNNAANEILFPTFRNDAFNFFSYYDEEQDSIPSCQGSSYASTDNSSVSSHSSGRKYLLSSTVQYQQRSKEENGYEEEFEDGRDSDHYSNDSVSSTRDNSDAHFIDNNYNKDQIRPRSCKQVSWSPEIQMKPSWMDGKSMLTSLPHENLIGAGLLTGASALILGGPIIAGVATIGAMYGYTQQGSVGDICRSLGDIAVTATEKVCTTALKAGNAMVDLDKKHGILKKTKDAASTVVHSVAEKVQEADESHRKTTASRAGKGVQQLISNLTTCSENALACVCTNDNDHSQWKKETEKER